ncbi:U-box domain-containing protein [Actinidia chinensis var. chinensis]|uniref:RING-type E3 ubiquitin transferase n=1 Tax=Actinidia chinensis var. chinensis TaxID=1590841 RepID=A0A2R6R7J7_ACTCC|nr:U-box domain-containing protein [Actinidia chinensis var. chinensis]
MELNVITNPAFETAAEVLSQIIESIIEIGITSKNVFIEKECFVKLANYLEKIVPLLKTLKTKRISNSDGLNKFIDILSREVKVARQLTEECGKRNKVYLLMNCRSISKRLEDTTSEISRALSLIPLFTLDISSGIIGEISQLSELMQTAEFKAALAEEEILEKIESGIQESNVDRSYANNLLYSIAQAVGASTEQSALKKVFEEFKSEIENAQLRKNHAEAKQMDQIIALLERADATSSPHEKELKYLTKRNSLGTQPLEPLQSFICPITGEVMVDPVEISSGHTFERSAIEQWFAAGNNLCPLTATQLDTLILRPNRTLRKSIEEWMDRNTMIRIASMKPKLLSGEEEEVLHCMGQLQDLCEQRDIHREWVTLENYIPILIGFLGDRSRDIRKHALIILCILAKDSDDAKARIARVDNAIESIVRFLGSRIAGKLAVALLLELSKSELIRDCICKVQGCILLLVTMSSSDESEVAGYARELLENLSFSNENVIQMAKANYFKHLLQHLSSGPEDVKLIMATTLAEMELTDRNKSSLLDDGVLDSLLHLVSHSDTKVKIVAVKALQNLSSLPKNGMQMIKEGVVRPLLDLLFHHTSLPTLKEEVATTIMHLAISTASQDLDETQVSLLESNEDIFRLFLLITFRGCTVQQSILRAFHAMCQSPSATTIKASLKQCSAVQQLLPLCELDDLNVRANAVKLLCCLTEDVEANILEHMGPKSIDTLLKIIRTSSDDEEIASAMGIISNLPKCPQITEWLLGAGGLPVLFSFLPVRNHNGSHQNQLIENAVGAISHFSDPTNQQSQKQAAEIGLIPVLVQLLESTTGLTRRQAALSLAQFSASSPILSRPVPKRHGLWCFSPPPETLCIVHRGICTVESSFCLVEADAVEPLVRVLGESDLEVCEAALDALLTLIEGERLQSGSKMLAEANAIPSMIKLLSAPSPVLQEKVLTSLERIFRLAEIKHTYGASSQMPLVDLTQRGNSSARSLAARILAQLDVLPDQSSYF